jgi:hypothetical protein
LDPSGLTKTLQTPEPQQNRSLKRYCFSNI